MSLWKRGRQYWADFAVGGKRYRKRLGTTNLRVAKLRERELLEDAGAGALNNHERGPKRLSEAIDAYVSAKRMHCSPRTIELEQERLSLVKKHFGDAPLAHDHCGGDCRIPTSAARRGHRKSHDQHGRGRVVARAQVLWAL